MASEMAKVEDCVNVEIIDKAFQEDRNVQSPIQRRIALWFEDVCDALEEGRIRNRDSDMKVLHDLLDALKREIQESCRNG